MLRLAGVSAGSPDRNAVNSSSVGSEENREVISRVGSLRRDADMGTSPETNETKGSCGTINVN
jgi:hypothetical protein